MNAKVVSVPSIELGNLPEMTSVDNEFVVNVVRSPIVVVVNVVNSVSVGSPHAMNREVGSKVRVVN